MTIKGSHQTIPFKISHSTQERKDVVITYISSVLIFFYFVISLMIVELLIVNKPILLL